MNIAVINLRDIFKYLIGMILVICLIGGATILPIKTLTNFSFVSCLDFSLSLISYTKNHEEKENVSTVSSILNLELGFLDKEILKNTDLVINEEELTSEDIEEIEAEPQELSDEVITERVEENNVPEKSTNTYKTVKVKNESDYKITAKMLEPNIAIKNKKDVFIYHAHTCESYTQSEKYKYKATGNFRTTNLDYTVARVGAELSKFMKARGFNVTHDKTYHDYPAYSGSYTRALETAEKNLTGKDTEIVFDIHRDALRKQQ